MKTNKDYALESGQIIIDILSNDDLSVKERIDACCSTIGFAANVLFHELEITDGHEEEVKNAIMMYLDKSIKIKAKEERVLQ